MTRHLVVVSGGAAALGALAARLSGGDLGACIGTALIAAALTLYADWPWVAMAGAVAGLLLTLVGGAPSPAVAYLLASAHAFVAARRVGGAPALAFFCVLLTLLLVRLGRDDDVVPILFLAVGPFLAGHALRGRDAVARQLEERAAELEAERDVYAELSVRYERARIAAELHDIVAHAISVMVVQASAGQRLADAEPEGAHEAFRAIADAARQAESDMSRLVTMLAEEPAEGDGQDLAFVRELVSRAAGTGLEVSLRVEGDRALRLHGPARRSAYLVVREGLTNALRYASGASVSVLVDARYEELVVDVVNTEARTASLLAGQGSGNGLRGLREHLDTCGGRLEAGRTTEGGWRLRARVPRPSRAPA